MEDEKKPDRGRIILADDDDLFRDAYSRLLTRNGFDCTAVADGNAALELLQTSAADALIADIHMPGNQGLELVESIPQVLEGLPVILLTGQPTLESARRSVRLPVVAYMVKPPELNEILALLDECIPRYRQLKEVRSNRERLEQWSQDLAILEGKLKGPLSARESSVAGDYLRVTLYNMITQLAELGRSVTVAASGPSPEELDKLELVAALQQAIAVLEGTRKNFKSKELGELRRRLSAVLKPRTGNADPGRPPGGGRAEEE